MKATKKRKRLRGFAAMDWTEVQRIARMGGLAVSRHRRHMAEIGRLGGLATHRKLTER